MRLLTVLFAMAFAAYADADTITKRDGTTVDGTITTCGEENCLIGSGGIARAEIARIDLAKPERMPAIDASESDVLVTIDGTVHIGTFTFLNLGYATMGEHDVERDQVAVIVMLGASPKDVIVFRNGRERSGRLVRCNASACTLDEESLPREQIVWIGLQQEGARPPRGDATVYLRDDSTARGSLVSIDAETVHAGERSFARNDVAWVRIDHAPE